MIKNEPTEVSCKDISVESIKALREEIRNPAIGSFHHLRKLALALLDELESSREHVSSIMAMSRDVMEAARGKNEQIDALRKQSAEWERKATSNFEECASLAQTVEKLERYRTAFIEWSDKTEWVHTDKRFFVIKPWGKHRADVMRLYIDHLEYILEKQGGPMVGSLISSIDVDLDEVAHMSGFLRDQAEGWIAGTDNARRKILAADIASMCPFKDLSHE